MSIFSIISSDPELLFIGHFAVGSGCFLYAKKKGYKALLAFFLGFFLNILGFRILIFLAAKGLLSGGTSQIGIFRLNRLKFYPLLLICTMGVFWGGYLFIKSIIAGCQDMECMAIGVAGIILVYIITAVIVAINLILIISYESINKNNLKNKFLTYIYILIIFAGVSYGVFGDLFFINKYIIEPKRKTSLEIRIDFYIKNRDIVGCIDYINNLSPEIYSGPEKTDWKIKCTRDMAKLYKDLSLCDYYYWQGSDYVLNLAPCYSEVLAIMHQKSNVSRYDQYLDEAQLFCEDLQNDRPPCIFIVDNPAINIINREEILSLCQLIKNPGEQSKCIKIYSKISREDVLGFCSKIKVSAKEECIEKLTRLIDLQK